MAASRPAPAEWSGDEYDLPFPHGTPLLVDGRLQAGTRDASFLNCPDVHTIKAAHIVIASLELAIGSGGARGLAAACDPRRIMTCPPLRDAAEVPPNGRCHRPGCAQLFAQAGTVESGTARDPADLIDPETGKVRVLRKRCATCVFRPGDLMHLGAGRLEDLVEGNLEAGALLTCHATLPYGDYPGFGPAACAGFWARFWRVTAAGRMARLIGLVRPMPPGDGGGDRARNVARSV